MFQDLNVDAATFDLDVREDGLSLQVFYDLFINHLVHPRYPSMCKYVHRFLHGA